MRSQKICQDIMKINDLILDTVNFALYNIWQSVKFLCCFFTFLGKCWFWLSHHFSLLDVYLQTCVTGSIYLCILMNTSEYSLGVIHVSQRKSLILNFHSNLHTLYTPLNTELSKYGIYLSSEGTVIWVNSETLFLLRPDLRKLWLFLSPCGVWLY